uniref:Uncharacterized protein n=1 Tax=Arundo donax TaxID=35708 RepID=A0A0A9AMK4_ARUDO
MSLTRMWSRVCGLTSRRPWARSTAVTKKARLMEFLSPRLTIWRR